MEFNIIMSPDFYSRIRLPYSQIIQSLNFLFNNENDGETTARLNCQFLTPDRSNIFGSPLIDSKNLNYLIEKQSHLPRLSTSHLNSQVISDQLLSNYYAMSVATATNSNLALHGQMAGPVKPQPRKKFTNDYSISLSKEENEYLFTLLGDRCVTLATAVIQLFLSEQPNHTRWRKKLTGVACFVKDNSRRNYFIRVYDLDHAQTCVWQQELYFTFQYRCPRPYFHTFEADNCMAALNFATDKEADSFRRVVLEKVNTMNQKHQEKKKAQQQRLNAGNQPSFSVPTLGSLSIGGNSYSSASTKERKKKDKKDKKEKKKYCKEDIGLPTNFQHLHHVGWNSGAVDFQLKQVLEEAGVSTNQYKNPETKQFIDNFVQQYTQAGGQDLSRAKENIDYGGQQQQLPPNYSNSSYNGGAYMPPMRYNSQKSNGPPPLPQSQPTYTYYSTGQSHRGSVDNSSSNNLSNNVNSQAYVSKPINPAPPVPGSQNSYKSQAPPPPPLPNHLANATGKSSAPNIPPPPPLPGNLSGNPPNMAPGIPPPPPLPTNLLENSSTTPAAINSAPKPPPPPMPSSQASDTRCALLDQIRQGRNLKKVDRSVQPAANGTNSQSSGDSRDALLDQIRAGKKLKSVEKNQTEKPAPALDTSGLAGALAKALQERSRVLQQTDDSSSDSSDSDSDEEWD